MDTALTVLLIVLVIVLLLFVTAFVISRFREDVRFTLYARFLNPLFIIAGKDHMVREGMEREVYSMIRQYPGISYSRLLEDLDLDDATLSFQLARILRENLISRTCENSVLSFSPYYVTKESVEARSLPPISPLETKILEGLRRLGPAARVEIETTLKLPPKTINMALDMLKKRGLVGFDGDDKWSYCWAESNQPRLR